MKSNFNSGSNAPKLQSWTPLLLIVLLTVVFWRSFLPDYVHFSNDGPLGQENSAWHRLPGAMTGSWYDLNDIGSSVGAMAPNFSSLIYLCLQPLAFAKFYPVCALFILGLGVWTFLRVLRLSPLAVTLGTLAAVFNSMYFAGACWGVASAEIAVGMDFFALACICANRPETPRSTFWMRLALAGFCVGMNVTEGADVGALCSVLVALFAFFKTWVESDRPVLSRFFQGTAQVMVIAVFATFLAIQTVCSLVSTSITGVAGTAQDTETKLQHWDWATQWSLPKSETLALVVPGLFGYKMDTPKDMMPQFKDYYEGGLYWGGIGRDPALDRWLDSGGQGAQPPSSFMRFTGGGNYVGILVCLLAAWAVALALRRQNSPFSPVQKKIVLFWAVVLFLSLLVAWGRFAPFYALLYKLPYFSTIRNPCKFLIFFAWALLVLFAYGVHALSTRHMAAEAPAPADPVSQFQKWWSGVTGFDRKWAYGCIGLVAASLLGWLIFSSEKSAFIGYLRKVGFGDENQARQIADFAIAQAGWFVPLTAVAVLLVLAAQAGCFTGPKSRLGAILLGAFLLFDLVRADLPYVIHWNYKQKYEVGSLNPIVAELANAPYEHRVAWGVPWPLGTPPDFELGQNMYRIEWMQHHFPYYNIQCLDIIQMPRMPVDLKTYLETFNLRIRMNADGKPEVDPQSYRLFARHCQLTNTRYLLAPYPFIELYDQMDPGHRFHVLQRYEIVPKPGILQPRQLEDLTAVLNENGRYALFEFTGALPRVKLYGSWEVNTNDTANLQKLASADFDPEKTVLVSTPEKALPDLSTNDKDPGSVEFKSYAPKKIILAANATTPAVLLLNDKFDAGWQVTVDGSPAQLLRCNYIMRGVVVPAGNHTVEFRFSLPNKPFYITLVAVVIGFFLLGYLVLSSRRKQPK